MDKIIKPLFRQPIPAEAKLIFKGIIFDVYQWQQKMYDGSIRTFEKLKRVNSVMVVPITTTGKIILVEEEQPGKIPFLGVAGGRAEGGENPEETATRELREETGFESDRLVLWDVVQPLSKIDWLVYTYVAKNCRKVSEQKLDSGERIRLKFVTVDEFIKAVVDKKLINKEVVAKVQEALIDPDKTTGLKKLLSN